VNCVKFGTVEWRESENYETSEVCWQVYC